MTSDEKLDLILEKVSTLDERVSNLEKGQMDIRNELEAVSTKVSETYQVALDAWGTSIENRKWLETAKQLLILFHNKKGVEPY